MKVVTYNPFKPLASKTFNNILEDIAGRSMSEFLGNDYVSGTPSVNILEHDDSYSIEIAAPGLGKENFSIELDQDQLIVSGSKKEEASNEDKEGSYSRREFNYQNFKRSFHISEDINGEDITAQCADGILTISLSKKVDIKDPVKTIEIG